MDNRTVAIEHYENFPVASVLCPPRLRPAIVAIYRFARTADDLADEGDASAESRREDLLAYRDDLRAVLAARTPSPRWSAVFAPLARAIEEHRLPGACLADLLDAFMQDVDKTRYADRAELLDYCRRSADPVGRLLLHLYGVGDAASRNRSDAICTALQLANFWQDLGVDTRRGRLYVPATDCRAHGIDPEGLARAEDSTATRSLVLELVAWTRDLMQSGADLVHAVPGRAGWELRLVVQGGLRILERIDAIGGATLATRPVVGWQDAPVLAWRALRMRRGRAAA